MHTNNSVISLTNLIVAELRGGRVPGTAGEDLMSNVCVAGGRLTQHSALPPLLFFVTDCW